jgi:hypothetical protein
MVRVGHRGRGGQVFAQHTESVQVLNVRQHRDSGLAKQTFLNEVTAFLLGPGTGCLRVEFAMDDVP